MLSRVADSLYWINRYVERAENLSRFVEVSEAMALDCPPGSAEPWQPLIDASGDRDLFDQLYPGGGAEQVVEFLVRADNNPSSIVNCIAMARENARQIRDVITTEMWEQINDLYWTLLESDSFWHQPPQEQLREIRRGCQLFYGITDATLSRDLSLQWISLLRSAGAYQMFRQSQQGVIAPKAVAAFLLLDPSFPRSVRYCLERIHETLQLVAGPPVPGKADPLECLSGLTQARWSYTGIDELVADGLHEAIDALQQDLNNLHQLIHARYLVLPSPANSHDLACAPA
jgi:uncharacterized alpha-E superfamily protein